MKKLITLLMIVGILFGLAFATEDGEKATEDGEKKVEKVKKQDVPPVPKDLQARPGRPSPRDRQRSADPQQRYRQMLSKQAEKHGQEIAELEAIRKIAEEEQATRTVAAIQEMIVKKNAAYKKRVEEFESRLKGRSKQVKRIEKSELKQPEKEPKKEKVKESDSKKESDK